MISTILVGALLAAAPPPEAPVEPPLPITGPAIPPGATPADVVKIPSYLLQEPTAELEYVLEVKFAHVVEALIQPEAQKQIAKASGAKLLEWKMKSVDLDTDDEGKIVGGKITAESEQEIRNQKLACIETIVLKPGFLSFTTYMPSGDSNPPEEGIVYLASTMTLRPAGDGKTKVIVQTWVEHATIREVWVRIGARSSMLRLKRCLEHLTKPSEPEPEKGVEDTILN